MVILDNLGIHAPKGSRVLRARCWPSWASSWCWSTPPPTTTRRQPDRVAVAALRRTVTHTHRRQTLADLVADADRWAHTITPAQVLSQIGSPFALDQQPVAEELDHAA